MERFAHEKLRVQAALLEIERQKAKLMIVTERANGLQAHAADSIEGIKTITAETEIVLTAVRRERRHL
jgi:hypothetical protein